MRYARWFGCILLALVSGAVQAHRPSDAYLTLTLAGSQLEGQWEVALRDLDVAVGLDINGDGLITWAELRAARPASERLLLTSLNVTTNGDRCPFQVTDLLVNDRLDGRYAWFSLKGDCSQRPEMLSVEYSLLFDVDPTHRGILVLHAEALTQTAVFSPASPMRSMSMKSASPWVQISDYFREGVYHIWIGIDHILFLVALLLPCVLTKVDGRWQEVQHLRPVLLDVAGVVTAFTAAHSITLSLAALGILRFPSGPVESVIAASIVLAALNNLRPMIVGRRWLMAFGFGLVHGLGFASALSELGLPDGARVLSVLAFNAGVEFGQLAIVVVLLPWMYGLRAWRFYRVVVVQAGSVAVGGIAILWMIERLASI